MGVYGPIDPGSDLETFAMIALRQSQTEEVAKTVLMASAGGDDAEKINKMYKQYLRLADPFTEEEIKRADARKRKLLDDEIKRGSFQVTPLVDEQATSISFRSKPRVRKPYALPKKSK